MLGLCGLEIPFGDVSRFHSLQAGVSDAISDTVDAPEVIRICYKLENAPREGEGVGAGFNALLTD